jgi:hypothetical protein
MKILVTGDGCLYNLVRGLFWSNKEKSYKF